MSPPDAAPRSAARGGIERLAAKIYLLWAGLSLGVAFVATPAKFLAPSLSLPVALDVGRHTFRIYNSIELTLCVLLLVLGAWSRGGRRWRLGALAPGAIILAQGLWLIPALDLRVAAIEAGRSSPPSNLHAVYIAAEALKLVWLLAMGFSDFVSGTGGRDVPSARRSHSASTVQVQGKP